MSRPLTLPVALLLTFALPAYSQVKETSVALKPVLTKALATSALTAPGSAPFHLRLIITEPSNPQSLYGGILEEWWSSSTEWRRDITGADGLHQIIVTHDGAKSEQDTGDYFPLWLRNFVSAAIDPVPEAPAWLASNANIEQILFPDGRKSDACARSRNQIGSGDQAVDVFSSLCFDDHGRLNLRGGPRFDTHFSNFRDFYGKQYARQLATDLEASIHLVGTVQVLEPLAEAPSSATLFIPLDRNDDRFRAVAVNNTVMSNLTEGAPSFTWPSIQVGKPKGKLAIYISADATGQVREAYSLRADNHALLDPARLQVLRWKIKSARDKAGNSVQIDGGLAVGFQTQIVDPLPELSETETRKLASHTVDPNWLPHSTHPGEQYSVSIRVDAQGKLVGLGFKDMPIAIQLAIDRALQQWIFTAPQRDGQPQAFYGKLHFTVRPELP